MDEELVVALAQYRDIYLALYPQLKALQDELDAAKSKVAKLALELGHGEEIEGASVGIRAGYERVSWETKMLEGLALVHPEINAAKKVRQVKPAAVVKVEL